MKKLLFFVLLTFSACSALAGTSAIKNSHILSVKVNFNFQYDQNGHREQCVINNNMKMQSNNHHWMIIQDQQLSSKEPHIVLLSKIEKSNLKTVNIRFLVLDTSKNSKVISKPEIVVAYGQNGKIMLRGKNGKLELSVLAIAY